MKPPKHMTDSTASGPNRHPLAGRRGAGLRAKGSTRPPERTPRPTHEEVQHAKRCVSAFAFIGVEAAHHADAFPDQRQQWAAIERAATVHEAAAVDVLRRVGAEPDPASDPKRLSCTVTDVLDETGQLAGLGLARDDRTIWLAGSEQAATAAAVRDCAESVVSALRWLDRHISASASPHADARLQRIDEWTSQWQRLGVTYRWDPKQVRRRRSDAECVETLHAWGALHALGLYDCRGAIVPVPQTRAGRGCLRAIDWALGKIGGHVEILGSRANQIDRYLIAGRVQMHTTRHWRRGGGRAFRASYHNPDVDPADEYTRRRAWVRLGARTAHGESGVDLDIQTSEGGVVTIAAANAELRWT